MAEPVKSGIKSKKTCSAPDIKLPIFSVFWTCYYEEYHYCPVKMVAKCYKPLFYCVRMGLQ
jgi:hypothetical protein